MEEITTLIFGHKNPDTDSICSSIVMEKFDKNLGFNVEAVRIGDVNKETQYVLKYLGIETPRFIESVEEGQPVVLVDHNEFCQSVNGIEKAKIVRVVDHHKIANFEKFELVVGDDEDMPQTVNGFIMKELETFPQVGDVIYYQGLRIEIKKIGAKRIEEAHVSKTEEEEKGAE